MWIVQTCKYGRLYIVATFVPHFIFLGNCVSFEMLAMRIHSNMYNLVETLISKGRHTAFVAEKYRIEVRIANSFVTPYFIPPNFWIAQPSCFEFNFFPQKCWVATDKSTRSSCTILDEMLHETLSRIKYLGGYSWAFRFCWLAPYSTISTSLNLSVTHTAVDINLAEAQATLQRCFFGSDQDCNVNIW